MSSENENMLIKWHNEISQVTIDPLNLEIKLGGKTMRLHLHHGKHMNSPLLSGLHHNPQMDTTQQPPLPSMEGIQPMPPMMPGMVQRHHPRQSL